MRSLNEVNMGPSNLKYSITSAEPVNGRNPLFKAESIFSTTQDNLGKRKERQNQKHTSIHSTPRGDATSRPPFLSRVLADLFANKKEAPCLEHLVAIGYRGFCIGALGSALVALAIAQFSSQPADSNFHSQRIQAKACYQLSSDTRERCV
ncbi:MAG: hypothetical protein J0M12_05815 [Deltaproteobacteria bacterium]|nr:hypothetical protein [Deltaproteobacteria bacterium]